jgi:DNA-binding PadR family transcriptional regulator
MDDVMNNLISELRRGTLIIHVLSQLKSPQYGYSLIEMFEVKGISIEANTLYPLLRRLEKQNLLESCWNTEGAKPRKYYKISVYGAEIYDQLCKAYFEIVENTNKLIMEDNQ